MRAYVRTAEEWGRGRLHFVRRIHFARKLVNFGDFLGGILVEFWRNLVEFWWHFDGTITIGKMGRISRARCPSCPARS